MREAGYNNEPITVLHARDSVAVDPLALVAVEHMRRAGFNIRLESTDWSTVAQRRTRREPVSQGGWSVVPLVWTGFDMVSPIVNPALVYNCADVYPGWWCDESQVALFRQFSEESDPARRRELAARLQERAHEHVNVVILGQFASPGVHRSDLQGVIDVGVPVLWNIRRERR
jgi:peptide/nickel transport system substrate-binding protein